VTLIAYLWGFMLLVTLLAAVAGWSWAEARARPRWRVMEEERRTLRAELLGLAAGGSVIEGNGEGGVAARRRISDLEQALAEARGRAVEVEVLRLRIAELERAGAAQPRNVAALDVTEYTSRIAALEAQLIQARDHIVNAGNFPARIEALEGDLSAARAALAAAPPPEDKNRIFLLEQELEAARGEVAAAEALAARVKELEAAPPPVSEDERNLLEWRNRYLGERVRYLETQTPVVALAEPAPEPVDTVAAQERADRRAWRARYFEQRALYLEGERAAAPESPPPVDDAPLKARIAELETQIAAASATAARVPGLESEIAALKASVARVPELEGQVAATAEIEHDTVRTKWKARYLEARVRYLEDKLNAAPEPAPVAPLAPAAEPAPVEKIVVAPPPAPVPEPARVFRLERPAALSAPRNGAPDDLRLIDGVNPQAQATLNAIGVFHFDQIARWSPAHVAWVDQYLNLRGRIVAERWVEQAQKLAQGVPA
jgi:predicted flap endonuclease-1-like 5' DNA nuclease